MRVGSLCSGYEGLGLAVKDVFPDAELAWVSDIDKGARKILAHRFPDVPNLGDMTKVDWTQVEPVDVLTGGTPCQDLSHAGKRAGMTEGTRSNLWVVMREAIAVLRPQLVIWENVGGAYSAAADSDLEPDAGLLGDRPGRPALRALGRVLGDLASLGIDAEWHGIRAADVGAPHGRLRVFVVAYPQHDGRPPFPLGRGAGASEGIGRLREPQGSSADPGVRLLAAPQSRDHKGVPSDGFNLASLPRDVSLLPTPAVNDMGEGKTVDAWDDWTAKMKAAHGNGNGHGASLAIEAQRLLPTPRASDGPEASSHGRTWSTTDNNLHTVVKRGEIGERLLPTPLAWVQTGDIPIPDDPAQFHMAPNDGGTPWLNSAAAWAEREGSWGDYAAAIHRWEHTLGRPAPAPTQTSSKGNPQLAPAFVEWMMGIPDGWVTNVPGLTRNDMLRALGNGVVPQQAAAALRLMLARMAVVA